MCFFVWTLSDGWLHLLSADYKRSLTPKGEKPVLDLNDFQTKRDDTGDNNKTTASPPLPIFLPLTDEPGDTHPKPSGDDDEDLGLSMDESVRMPALPMLHQPSGGGGFLPSTFDGAAMVSPSSTQGEEAAGMDMDEELEAAVDYLSR